MGIRQVVLPRAVVDAIRVLGVQLTRNIVVREPEHLRGLGLVLRRAVLENVIGDIHLHQRQTWTRLVLIRCSHVVTSQRALEGNLGSPRSGDISILVDVGHRRC
ncbi:hypothetical protein [Corynebacterium parakroppenstedtii]|uniref:hypothetical protein n=1 Tax=Corynebacterium parakroppenstedtii TaxID=2828363 RepID=UPI0030EF7CC1